MWVVGDVGEWQLPVAVLFKDITCPVLQAGLDVDSGCSTLKKVFPAGLEKLLGSCWVFQPQAL